jgi:hypothetical protein
MLSAVGSADLTEGLAPLEQSRDREGAGYGYTTRNMDLQSRLDALLAMAEEIGLKIRREPLGGDGGGYCLLRGQRVLFVDTAADLETRYERTLAALAPLAELDQRYLPPEVREEIDRQRQAEKRSQKE